MQRPKHSIFVDGEKYNVTERPGYLKADMHGLLNWTSVWADTYTALVKRIRLARRGGQ